MFVNPRIHVDLIPQRYVYISRFAVLGRAEFRIGYGEVAVGVGGCIVLDVETSPLLPARSGGQFVPRDVKAEFPHIVCKRHARARAVGAREEADDHSLEGFL